MRLLKRSSNGNFKLVSFTDDDNVPPYAILSHTWLHGEEVLYNELVAGTRTGKAGYRKLDFCAARAAVDSLDYFWIDTCCIDKSTSDELSTAINSMFRWYQRAARCYVYLSDVTVPHEATDAQAQRLTWVDAFRQSRWFTRGWTLQELLAPATVEFFSHDGRLLGSKISLEKDIHEITKIPPEVLRGQELAKVSTEERMSWATNRTTTLKEDKVYCLLGIFGVFLPLIYGEGEAYATQRLHEEIERRQNAPSPAGAASSTPETALPLDKEQLGSSLLPFPRNELFVGRESQLQSLKQCLLGSDVHRRMTIHGLGGCGKSALALEFAYRVLAAAPGHLVFWVPALSQGSFELAYREIALRLRLPGATDDDANIKPLVKDSLSVNAGHAWLMIVDNADDPGVLTKCTSSDPEIRLHDYLPHSARGRVLFTTRSRKVAGELSPGNILELQDMSRADARQLLAGRVANQNSLDDENVSELLSLLAYLPLAIVQAAAFIDSNEVSITEYISLLREKDTAAELFSQHFEDVSRYGQVESTIAKTWYISFDHLRQQDPLAAQYLSFMAFIDRVSIPRSLLPPGGSVVQQLKAIGTLKGYAFITERQQSLQEAGGERLFDMHRLVHMASIWWLEMHGEQNTWTVKAADRLEEMIPYGDAGTIKLWTSYLSHAIYMAREEGSLDDTTRASLLSRVGRCQLTLGQYSSAVETHRQGLSLRERALGKEHPLTMTSRSNLAEVLAGQGNYDEAEAMNRITLQQRESLLGPQHLDTLTSMVKLAVVLIRKGKHDETETLLRKTLKAQTMLLGPHHRNTLTSMNNLALVLNEKHKYDEAEEIYRVILAQEKSHRPDHRDTLKSISNLAAVLGKQGKDEAAEELYRDALAGHVKQMGLDHPDTLLSLYSFAHFLGKRHRFAEAAVLYEKASTGFSAVLGDDHPITRQCKAHYSDINPLSLQRDTPPLDSFLDRQQQL